MRTGTEPMTLIALFCNTDDLISKNGRSEAKKKKSFRNLVYHHAVPPLAIIHGGCEKLQTKGDGQHLDVTVTVSL